jgi:hypothetical protein
MGMKPLFRSYEMSGVSFTATLLLNYEIDANADEVFKVNEYYV